MITAEHISILETIELISDSFDGAVKVYTNGSCVKFAMLLEYFHPGGEVLYDLNHAIYEYNGVCYDITGMVEKGSHRPLKEFGWKEIRNALNLKGSFKVL